MASGSAAKSPRGDPAKPQTWPSGCAPRDRLSRITLLIDDAAPSAASGPDETLYTLDDVNAQFLPLPEHHPDCRHVRGVLWVVAQDLVSRLPARPQRDQAINHLVTAADKACEALTAG